MNTQLPPSADGMLCPVKPYSTKELAQLYGISVRVFLNWLQPFKPKLGKKKGWFWNVLQIKLIFSFLGAPYIQD